MPEIQIYENDSSFNQAVVERFIQQAQARIEAQGWCSVALSGGSTPAPIYAALATKANRDRILWEKVHLFWGDERHVPPTDPDSNYRMVRETLLSKVSLPLENVHRVPAELEVGLAAERYQQVLRDFFEGAWPRFDLVLLGMGSDGHTASLFPYSDGLGEAERWFIANRVADEGAWRLTLTTPAINAARLVLVLVKGEGKARMLRDVIRGDHDPEAKPIQAIDPTNGTLVWMVDRDAAQCLPDLTEA